MTEAGHVVYSEELTLVEVLSELRSFESINGLRSEEFFERYLRSDFVGDSVASTWASYWILYLRMTDGVKVTDQRRYRLLTSV